MYEKILVPLNGSELAQVALPYAEELAGRLGSEVTLICVGKLAEDQQYDHMRQFYIQGIAEVTKRGIERYIKKPKEKAIKVESKILVGDPAEEIINYADKEDISLIVMATHTRPVITRWALGSIAEKVVRAAKQPVVLIRAKGTHPDVRKKGILKKVLVTLDGSKESEAVIPYIEELASKLKAEVVLLQVLTPRYLISDLEKLEHLESLRASAKDYIEKMEAWLKQKGITVKSEVREVMGNAAEEIIKFADEIQADVVAMSTHGHSGVSRWAFGSVTDKVLHTGNTPLLLVRTPEAGKE